MNLRSIANSVITSVNPNQSAILKINEGNTVDDEGNQIPRLTETPITIQPQSIATADLEHLNLVSQQGQFLYAYANGSISALRRSLGKGSERIVFTPYGEDSPVEWIVKQVIESYPDWVKVLLWRQ